MIPGSVAVCVRQPARPGVAHGPIHTGVDRVRACRGTMLADVDHGRPSSPPRRPLRAGRAALTAGVVVAGWLLVVAAPVGRPRTGARQPHRPSPRCSSAGPSNRCRRWPGSRLRLVVVGGPPGQRRPSRPIRCRGADRSSSRPALLAIAFALLSGIDRYDTTLFSVHMVQHVLLTLVAAPLLALAAPITLILRLRRPRPAGAGSCRCSTRG